jgi:glycosyltransferase involved in cell wall biosynthesis
LENIKDIFNKLNPKEEHHLSIVLPVYNEEESLPKMLDALTTYLGSRQAEYNWELIFIDDFSTDRSFDILAAYSKKQFKNIRIAVLQLSKNSGSHIAITAGINLSRADLTIIMASDGQDPPEVIEQLINHWKDGEKIILAARDGNLDKSSTGNLFSRMAWKIMNWATGIDMPEKGCDMLAIDKQPLEAFNKMDERNTTFIYRLLSLGYSPKVITYLKRERIGGQSKWTFWKKVRIMLDAITGYSNRPLRLITRLSLLLFFVLIIRWGFVIFKLVISGEEPDDRTVILNSIFTSLAVTVLIMSALGDYIWRILDEARKRPIYNFNKIEGTIFEIEEKK